MFSFNFKGQDSFVDFGLLVEKRPILPKPERNIDYFEVPGRDGSLKVDYETYKDVIIPLSCSFRSPYVPEMADRIKGWLDSGEGPLIFSNQPDRYYLAHVVEQVDIAQEYFIFGKFLVNFRCKPFKYAINNNVMTLTSPGSVINSASVKSNPSITVYGTGMIQLTVGDTTTQLNNVSEYVTIDSELMDAYKGTQLKNGDMIGEFPVLAPGVNAISWDGAVTKVEITPNWRWL